VKKKAIHIIIILFLSLNTYPQTVFQPLTHKPVYDFLDELATDHVIDLTSIVKPYPRMYIAEKLFQADTLRSLLTEGQQAELDFYLEDFNKERYQKGTYTKRIDLLHYKDRLFNFTINPILGSDMWYNENGFFYHWWNGLEAWSYVGKWSFYANIRDNHESTILTARDFMNQRIGAANIKSSSAGNRDYEEIRGGVAYSWRTGSVGLFMDQFAWGENHAGANIFSGRTPAFARFDLHLTPADWFDFHYVHGQLVSEVVDSINSFWTTSSYGNDLREVYHPKFLAANIFTFTPIKYLQLSAGNSVIYDYRSPHIAYMIPVMFWKAIDHTLNARIDNMNSQMFFSASSRNIRHLHLHATLFVDELKITRLNDPDEYNLWSLKAGLHAVNLLSHTSNVIPRNSFTVEYTISNALTFRHYVPTLTFESNQYNLGHYLEDNARDLYIALSLSSPFAFGQSSSSSSLREYNIHPLRNIFATLRLNIYFNNSRKGPDHTFLGTEPRMAIKPFTPTVWESTRFGIRVNCQVVNNLYLRLGYEWRNVTGEQPWINMWTPGVFHGMTNTWLLGINFGY
jgi:hypothetical protein